VPGEGAEKPDVLFIGEAPGVNEDQQGRPFVGQAGRLLDDLLAGIGLRRADVYIANVVKCRPPNNRDPLPFEIEACAAFLDRQISILAPRMIVTLGRFSMAKFFSGETISKIHGRPVHRDRYVVLPLYHPAAALHQPNLRKVLQEDMGKIPGILGKLDVRVAEEEKAQPSQLTLF
jgi:DNA polymerase